MRSRIVRIGNSQGVRIPKVLLEEAGVDGDVELRAESGRIVIEAARQPRAGWAEAAAEMRADEDDQLIIPERANRFDREEWDWPRR